MMLCEKLLMADGRRFARPWNFGPDESASVIEVARLATDSWGGGAEVEIDTQPGTMKEHRSLEIDASDAIRHLGWKPSLGIAERVKFTMDWYKQFYGDPDPRVLAELTLQQVRVLAEAFCWRVGEGPHSGPLLEITAGIVHKRASVRNASTERANEGC